MPLILGIIQIALTKIRIWRDYLSRLRYPAVIAFMIIILGLGLVPCYTSNYAQAVTIQEEWLSNSNGRLHIFSTDNLPPKFLDDYNVRGQKEIFLQGYNNISPINIKVTAKEKYLSKRLLDLYLNLNYLQEPYLLRITIQSQEPFQITEMDGFLPVAKLPKSIVLKGKKFGDNFLITMESTPPYNKTIRLGFEANGQIKCKIEALLAYNSEKLIFKNDSLSINYQTLVQEIYNF
jgi:hypothetical protein